MVMDLKGFTQVDPWELEGNVFKALGKDYMEIVAGSREEGANAMTAAWGGLGVMWNVPVAYAVVRGEAYRHTRHLMDEQPLFTLCFLGDEHAKAKGYLGSVHGWDVADKIAGAGLSTGWVGLELSHNPAQGIGEHFHTPFIEESDVVLVCETVFSQELEGAGCVDPELWKKWYTDQGEHRLYIAEIKAAYRRDK